MEPVVMEEKGVLVLATVVQEAVSMSFKLV
jgi:hypothetical protein